MRKTQVITPVSCPRAVCNAASVNLNQALTRYDSTALRVDAVSKSQMTLRRGEEEEAEAFILCKSTKQNE